ncbi:MAG: Ribose transport system permease protein RbsC [Planctomycetes bacterium ADurb.Bin401]|jgi:ribose transport system permease protein|nr:MAG: Ribose transport system permease protein RbsC [Planctomycetes bacterium ADurb.Bin401]
MKKVLGIFVIFIILCIFLSVMNPRFLSITNLQNLARVVGMFGIFSIGVGFVIITGGIDLSVGSLFAFLGIVLYMLLVQWHIPWVLAVGIILAIALIIGFFHGLLVSKVKIQPFIATLCGMLIYRGLAQFIAKDATKGFGYAEGFEGLCRLSTGAFLGVPMPFILLILVGSVTWIVLHQTVYGRYLMAVGRNEEGVRYSGVNTNLVILFAYIISSFLAGISAILFAFYSNAIAPSSHGSFYELYAIAAAVLGGCSLRGGEGTILGIIVGAALLQVLQNLVNLLGIPSSLNYAVMGGVILISVIVDQVMNRNKG